MVGESGSGAIEKLPRCRCGYMNFQDNIKPQFLANLRRPRYVNFHKNMKTSFLANFRRPGQWSFKIKSNIIFPEYPLPVVWFWLTSQQKRFFHTERVCKNWVPRAVYDCPLGWRRKYQRSCVLNDFVSQRIWNDRVLQRICRWPCATENLRWPFATKNLRWPWGTENLKWPCATGNL